MTGEQSWRLALPMYNVTPSLRLAWDELLQKLIDALRQRGWREPMQIVHQADDLLALWSAPDLLLAQTCGYPLATRLRDQVQVLGAPELDLPHCQGLFYRSLLLVRQDSGIKTLADLRDKRAAFNETHSQSGMNALRHSVAPLAREGCFFASVLAAGSHLASMRALQEDRADVAAIDCVLYAYAQRETPASVAGLRLLHLSAQAPGLPYITSRWLDAARREELRAVLRDLPAAHPELAARLALRSIQPMSLADYQPILDMEDEAIKAGYPALA